MPKSHQEQSDWNPGRLLQWANGIGPRTRDVIRFVLELNKVHPEYQVRPCLGIFNLGKRYGRERLEAACAVAMTLKAPGYQSVHNILKNGRDRIPLIEESADDLFARPVHENLRGSQYYS